MLLESLKQERVDIIKVIGYTKNIKESTGNIVKGKCGGEYKGACLRTDQVVV